MSAETQMSCKCDPMERGRRARHRWRAVGRLSEEEVRQAGGLADDWLRRREASSRLCVCEGS